ncbi:P-loop containing nucleoside triphosphate hydrolase protein [Fomitopsis serialis]|uniref:P-loop containing nucleoside triphosphate hydrolase protein n=1 Tax=Fomitopsis serialis TaxID=139415 RepID=UPI002008804E|nr:P-loop containing nucleoside triphosphate hydrolase protein [Neoantrodia serialis]KAH9918157.1 P-loop containing nucleoside triphosphate hydrolase protein [Neoantrodia serialis]
MATEFHTRAKEKMTARKWQLDEAESLVLGLDSSYIAGTGAGKTVPYMLPLFLPEFRSKVLVVVSPLKSLQRDQTRRFRHMGIEACAVNGDTWSESLRKDLLAVKYRAVFTSPEMCLEHPACRETMSQLGLSERIGAWVIDEAHCISQWGGDFRPTYDKLDKLRAIVHGRTPVLALSATLTPSVLEEIETKTHIDPMTSYHLNLGNDRPNIKQVVVEMKSKDDLDILDTVLDLESISASTEVPKTLIFANTRAATMQIWRHIREKLNGRMDEDQIDFLHAYRRRRGRERVMQRFREGDIRILVATEAAGMGADIPDIERVVQFGVPSSLTVWIQRAGRSPDIQAVAILLVEKSAFQQVATKKRKKKAHETTANAVVSQPEKTYKMNVENALRVWLETPNCRRVITDEYFNNPPRDSTELRENY